MTRRICVIGAGRWGRNHIRTLHSLGCLGGIAESSETAREALAAEYPGAAVYADHREAMAAGFDGYTVATPAETHYAIARELLENGCHVLVEKPITLYAREAADLKRLADGKGLVLMVGHVLLFHPAIQKMRELIRAGKIGRLQYIYSNRLNLGTVRTEENILWSFAPHDISVFQFLIGSMPHTVHSDGGAFLQPAIHDTTLTVLKYPNNIVAHIFVSWLHPFKEQRLVVIGSKGMLSYEDTSAGRDLLFHPKGVDLVNGEPVKRDGETETVEYERGMPLTEEMRYFVSRLDGGPVEIADGANAVEVLEVLEKATQSLRERGGIAFM